MGKVMRGRKRPVEVDYMQWAGTPEDGDAILDWIARTGTRNAFWIGHRLCIHTLEGVMECMPGDFVIRGVEGEHHPVKPNIFAKTYEVLGEADDV